MEDPAKEVIYIYLCNIPNIKSFVGDSYSKTYKKNNLAYRRCHSKPHISIFIAKIQTHLNNFTCAIF